MKVVSTGSFAVLIALVVMVEAANVPPRYFEPTRMNEGDRIMSDSCVIFAGLVNRVYTITRS